MVRYAWLSAVVLVSLFCAQVSSVWHDPSTHKIQFVTVDENVRLEVLDWGGAGRPVVLLSGLGGTAHTFDDFAPKLTASSHAYGVTRRGFGASSIAASGYDANRLGDDVLAVLDALKLSRPVLVGASLGGEELSSVGSRHPGRVAGLVYLDAAYPYAFDNGKGMSPEEFMELLQKAPQPPAPNAADRASFASFRVWLKRITGIPIPEAEIRQTWDSTADGRVGKSRTAPNIVQAVFAGMEKYADIRVPVLAIYAVPLRLPDWLNNSEDAAVPDAGEAFRNRAAILTEKQAKAVESGVAGSRVVRLPNASHLVFASNEAAVLREIRAFLATLK